MTASVFNQAASQIPPGATLAGEFRAYLRKLRKVEELQALLADAAREKSRAEAVVAQLAGDRHGFVCDGQIVTILRNVGGPPLVRVAPVEVIE